MKILSLTVAEILNLKDFKTESIDTAAIMEIIDLGQPETILSDWFCVSGIQLQSSIHIGNVNIRLCIGKY